MGVIKKKAAVVKTELLDLMQLKLKEQSMSNKELASRLQLSVSATQNMLKGNKMTLDRLHELSLILDFNFFRFWASQLQIDQPESVEIGRIKELEIENRTLMKLIKS
ncbi:hypothetical protein [Mangrovibacterium lignilyticum]|uniref:hypothetical protein n=1 Tax=Mangrovibacterium lignilyticum TaxID=2668052 RepID=UPI0013D5352E|nr:hypothetical protein [Mangrovibacterium lignilyticum]